MRKIILFSILSMVFSFSALSQNYIYQGDNQYEATNSWRFKMNAHYWHGDLGVAIAKHSNGGYLMISVNVPSMQHYIKGIVFVFLSDGSIIRCYDRGIRDHVDNQSIALYNFTMSEMEKLKNHRITRIRFSIYKGSFVGSETYTADNTKGTIFLYGSDQKRYYETDIEVKELFE